MQGQFINSDSTALLTKCANPYEKMGNCHLLEINGCDDDFS